MKAYNSAGALLQTGGGGGGGGGGTFSGGFSTMGNTAGDTGVKTDRLVLVGSNNITLSGSTNGGSITVSIIGGAGGGGGSTLTFFATGNTTQSSTGTINSTSIIMRGSNIVSVGISNGSLIFDATTPAQSNQQMTLFATGNTTQSSTGTTNASSVIFRGAGLVSVGITAGSVVVSGVQSNVAFSADASSTFQTLTFQDSNGISFSNNAGAIRITHGLQFTSNTSAITSNAMHSTSRPAFSADASSTFQTLTFQDSNGISFSNNAGALRITHGLQFTSNTSNITSNALNTSASRVFNIIAATNNTGGGTASLSSNVSFSAANGLTFYTSAGNAVVGSYTVPSVTNSSMTVSDAATSGTLARLAFTNLNGITLSLSTGAGGSHTIVGSYTVPTVTNSSWSVSDAATSGTVARLAFTNLNGVTLSLSTGAGGSHTIVGSHNALTSQSNQAFSAAGGASNFQTLSFSDNANVSWTNNAGQVAITSLRGSFYATSNTTLSTSHSMNLHSVIFAGAGIASVGVSSGSVVISVPAGGGAGDGGNMVGVSTGGHTAGNTGTSSTGTFVFEGTSSLTLSQITGGAGVHTIRLIPAMSQLTAGAGISLSTNGSTITIMNISSALSAGMSNLGSTAGTTGLVASQIVFVGTNGMLLSQSVNGQSATLTFDDQQRTISSYQNMPVMENSSVLTFGMTSLSQGAAFMMPAFGSFSFLRFPVTMSTNSTTLATMASATASAQGGISHTFNAVIYSLGTGASSRSLMSVTSGSLSMQQSQKISVTNSTQASYSQGVSVGGVEGGAATNRTTQYSVSNTNYSFTTNQIATEWSAGRFFDIPMAISLSVGQYWLILGASSSSSTAGAAGLTNLTNCHVRYSGHYGASQVNVGFGVMGSTNMTSGGQLGNGFFSTAGGGTTANLPISAISSTASNPIPFFMLLRSA
jgi:hypothetical protein